MHAQFGTRSARPLNAVFPSSTSLVVTKLSHLPLLLPFPFFAFSRKRNLVLVFFLESLSLSEITSSVSLLNFYAVPGWTRGSNKA